MSARDIGGRVTKHPDVRREELLKAAMELFYSQGFDNTSIQNITDAVGVAKGLFYHYFDSKQDALNAAVHSLADDFFDSLPRHASDMEGDARDKIESIINRVVGWKFDEQREMIVTYLRVMYRPENYIVRTMLGQEYSRRLAPLFTEIIAEGVRDGICDVADPEAAAETVFAMWIGGAERLGELLLESVEDPSRIDALLARIRGWENGVERLLGIEDGTLGLYDYDFLRSALSDVASLPDPDDGIPPPVDGR